MINVNRPLHAGAVYIKGNPEPLRDCCVYISGHFVIVARDGEEGSPDWYNADAVERMESVEIMTEKKNVKITFS